MLSDDDGDREEEEGDKAKFTANRGPRGYFIVLDRLYDTLEQRTGLWSHRLQKANRPTGWMTRSKVQREIWEQRLVVAYDLASALEYMHSMGIAYRDLVSFPMFFVLYIYMYHIFLAYMYDLINLVNLFPSFLFVLIRNRKIAPLTSAETSNCTTLVCPRSSISPI